MNIVYQPGSVLKPSTPLPVVLVLACGAQLMVVLDGLIVSVALPDMRTGLHLTPTGQQWIVTSYLVAVGGLLLLAARIADILGHRRVFLAGLAVFTLASLTGGLAQNGTVLIAARFVQGVGAAALAPSSLSLLTLTHTGAQRAKALSIWSATSGSAGALGLVLGGVITGGLGWRWVLLVNVPIGIALWALAVATLAPNVAHERRRVDLLGAVTVTVAVGALTYAISRAESGWDSPAVALGLIAAVAFAVLFIATERRTAQPLIPLSIFRRPNLMAANAIIAAVGAVMTATVYFLSLYEQRVLDLGPLRTGLALVPMSIVLTAGAIASRTLLQKYGAHRLITAGSLTMAIGLAWLATIPDHGQYLTHLLGPTLTWALGASIVVMPCVALATSDIDPAHAGLASGLVNTARQVGGAVGLAVLASIANTAAHSDTGDPAGKIAHGYRVAFLASAVIAVLIALSSLATHPRETRRDTAAAAH